MVRPFLLSLALLALSPAWAAEASSPVEDLDLARAESLWQRHNRDVQLGRDALQAAEADHVAAGQAPNPQLSLSTSSLNPRTGIGGGSLTQKRMDSVLRLDQLIERGNKRELRQQVSGAMLDAAHQGLADIQRQSRLQLRAAYWDLRLAQERQQISEESAALYRRSVQASETRLKVGDVAGSDVSRLRIEAGRAENEARSAAADLDRARQMLAYLIGKEQQAAQLRAVEAWPGQEVAPVAGTLAEIDARPDVQAARARVKAAEAARELARAARTRDVSVGVQFEHYPPGNESPNNTYGVSVSVPLFVRHAYEGEIARAEADLQAARTLEDQVRALALGEVAQAESALRAAVERRQRLESGLLAEAEKVARSSEYAYSRGALGVMDLLDARRTLRAVRLDAAVLRAEHAKALAAWQAAQGQ